ncbi:DegT/DnrJ/EryC1/StrS family aminotransferase [Microbispora bryophytorum]|uniref:DegT/DnrJ/EryC1/StrS family aminotransferase n=1 Tax=Microbispora bryophytorum TaxID=1460882 RepID=UPI0033E52298
MHARRRDGTHRLPAVRLAAPPPQESSAWLAPHRSSPTSTPPPSAWTPDAASAAITSRTAAAVLPVQLYGHPAALNWLLPLADRHGLALIEDACQAHAATLHSCPVGAASIAGCFSFYPSKNMQTIEGGMITASDLCPGRQAAPPV